MTKCLGLRISCERLLGVVERRGEQLRDDSANSVGKRPGGSFCRAATNLRGDGMGALNGIPARAPACRPAPSTSSSRRRPALRAARHRTPPSAAPRRQASRPAAHPGTSRRPAAAGRPRCHRCRRTACCGRLMHDRLRLAHRLAADGARVLERDRVALLRHDAAALHEPVAETDVVEFSGGPEQQVLHETAEPGDQRPSPPTRSRAGSPPSRCCRRCCPSAREAQQVGRQRRDRWGSRCR